MRHVSYNEMTETITLQYIDSDKDRVAVDVTCDKAALEPEVSLESADDDEGSYQFSVKTVKACFVPTVQCTAETQSRDIFNFDNLRENDKEWDFSVAENQMKYQVKVCGNMPILSSQNYAFYPCRQQSGICYYNADDPSGALSLGVMRERPVVNEDGSITMKYSGGSKISLADNTSCEMSAQIIFNCFSSERGPALRSQGECEHVLTWDTPEACPVTTPTSHSCSIREPSYGHVFNLTQLRDTSTDYVISYHKNALFYFNLCGKLNHKCPDNAVCLEDEINLTHSSGLKMEMMSKSKCQEDPSKNITVNILFSCHHDTPVGLPEVINYDTCQYTWSWRTAAACPPHDVVRCSVETEFGEVDLSQLSLPDDNYPLQRDDGESGVILINVCRSLVHSQANCPYQAGACWVRTEAGQVKHENLGQVQRGPLTTSDDGGVYLEYKLGSICSDAASNRSHIQTRINFECSDDTNTMPELVTSDDCNYVFRWKHAAACPIKKVEHGDCTVTNPVTGYTYDLSSLRRQKSDYNWTGVYHHLKGSFQFNVCGPMVSGKCGGKAGVCSANGTNFGQGNSDLIIEDGQLFLNYSNGDLCEAGEHKVTQINFNCPYVRNFSSSGNYEQVRSRYNVQQLTRCFTQINFPTELACEHQVLDHHYPQSLIMLYFRCCVRLVSMITCSV